MSRRNHTTDAVAAFDMGSPDPARKVDELRGTPTASLLPLPPLAAREIPSSLVRCAGCRRISVRAILSSDHLCGRCARLARQYLLRMLACGQLPDIVSPGIPLHKGERAHFFFPRVDYRQERVVSRTYEGKSSGASVRIAKGLTYRVGSQHGRCVVRSNVIHISTGNLLLTSKRLIFSGNTAFSIPLLNILHATPYSNGVSVTKDSTAQNNKPFFFMCADGELLNAALSACLNAAE